MASRASRRTPSDVPVDVMLAIATDPKGFSDKLVQWDAAREKARADREAATEAEAKARDQEQRALAAIAKLDAAQAAFGKAQAEAAERSSDERADLDGRAAAIAADRAALDGREADVAKREAAIAGLRDEAERDRAEAARVLASAQAAHTAAARETERLAAHRVRVEEWLKGMPSL